MANNVVQILINGKDNSAHAFQSAEKNLKGLDNAATDANKSTGAFGGSWSMLLLGINQGIQILQAAGQALKQVYEVAKEGAELEFAATKFDRLAESVGTTADLLLYDLREATQGMFSDAELMASASDMMALGLAKTHDEAVRLAAVAGGLNMNMNQLVLTLTNQTTMRFDALGVSVDGFKEKVAELEAQGMDTNEAFKEAFLQQAEAQIERVGSAADTAAGTFMKFEAAIKNSTDRMKKNISESKVLTGAIDGLTESMSNSYTWRERLTMAQEQGLITQQEWADLVIGVNTNVMTLAEGIAYLDQKAQDYNDNIEESARLTEEWAQANDQGYASSLKAVEGIEDVDEATISANLAMQEYNRQLLFKIASEGLSAEAAFELAKAMGLVDETTVAADEKVGEWQRQLDEGQITLEEYNALVSGLADGLDRIKDKSATVTVTYIENYERGSGSGYGGGSLGGGNTPQAQAAGGLVHAAGGAAGMAPYWVGEVGPEPFFPAQDGRILSHSDAMSAMKGSGGDTTVIVEINSPITTLDRAFLERELEPILNDYMRKLR